MHAYGEIIFLTVVISIWRRKFSIALFAIDSSCSTDAENVQEIAAYGPDFEENEILHFSNEAKRKSPQRESNFLHLRQRLAHYPLHYLAVIYYALHLVYILKVF